MAARSAATLLSVATVLTAAGCGPSGGPPTDPAPTAPANPLAGATLWRDPQGVLPTQVDKLRRDGRADEADRLAPLANQPVATWLASDRADPFADAQRVTTAAAAAGQLPVLVAYHRPDRDCGSYSAGGSPDAAAYLAWVGKLGAGIGDRPAVVIVEPDALAQTLAGQCRSGGGGSDLEATAKLLGQAVDVLAKQPQTRVYLDAGHAGWIQDTGRVADALRTAGVERAAGFSLNVSNFQTTADSQAYGERISQALGGQTQFVVDVSRNGRGAPAEPAGSQDTWCNPSTAGLGPDPAVAGERAVMVATLWIKEPGVSDGACRAGAPEAGLFWPDYALRLVEQRG